MARPPKKSKRFEYNLQTVLKVRNIQEKQEQEKFTRAEDLLKAEKVKEEKLKTQQREEYSDLKERMGPGKTLDFQQMAMRRTHLDKLKVKVVEQEQVRLEAEKKRDAQRLELIKAVKNRKILDKDKEHKRTAWQGLMKKEEEKFINDISSVRFERQSREKRDQAASRNAKKKDAN